MHSAGRFLQPLTVLRALRVLAICAATGVLAAAGVAAARPAAADSGPQANYNCSYYNWAPGWWQQNVICIGVHSGHYNADVWNNSGQQQNYDFNLICTDGRRYDDGPGGGPSSFSTPPFGNSTFTFPETGDGQCHVALWNAGGGNWLNSPSASNRPSAGYTCRYYNWTAGWWQQNVACAQGNSRGVGAAVWNNSDQWQNYDFNLDCDNGHKFGDQGPFWTAPFSLSSYSFSVRSQGNCSVALNNIGDYNGDWLYSPSVFTGSPSHSGGSGSSHSGGSGGGSHDVRGGAPGGHAASQGAGRAASTIVPRHHSQYDARPDHGAPAAHAGWAKYYVVPPSTDGHVETLREIAAKTLHNGNRAMEIFNLNKGRVQPGGLWLEEPTVIDPGWILVLPANASGPGVHYGPIPVVAAAPVISASSPRPSKHKPLKAPAILALPVSQNNLAAGGAIMIALLLAVGLVISRRRQAGATGKPGSDSRTALPAPEPRARKATGGAPATPGGNGAGGKAPARPEPPEVSSGPGTCATPAASDNVGAVPWPDYLMANISAQAGRGNAGPGATAASLSASLAVLEAPQPTGTGQPASAQGAPVQKLQLTFGHDAIDVVLPEDPVVSRDGKPGDGHTRPASVPYLVWDPLPYADMPDGGIAFACLGTGDQGCLFLDLAAAPGVVAIDGDDQAAARLAESIAHQLCIASADSNCSILVIGDALPPPLPSGATGVTSVHELGRMLRPQPPGDSTEVVFCRPGSVRDTLALARYASSAEHRIVPVVLGSVPDAAWSFTARPTGPPDEARPPHSRHLRGWAASMGSARRGFSERSPRTGTSPWPAGRPTRVRE
jgi:hypothetical protein